MAGHTGLVGSALVRALNREGYLNLVMATHQEIDLTVQTDVSEFFACERPEYVFLAAAKVGGIMANIVYPAQFIYDNLMMEANIIHESWKNGVKKLLFLGSTCIYPQMARQPITEDALLTGPLEPSNAAYAIAKIAGLKMCQAYNQQYGTKYIAAMPTNLYGPHDHFNLETGHVLPALLRKFHEAKRQGRPQVVVWGSGGPIREFLYIDDLAEACLFLMNHYEGDKIVNVGTGSGISIAALADLIRTITGYEGEVVFDKTKPDGMPVKVSDVSYLKKLGWQAATDLRTGIGRTYNWFCRQGFAGD